MKMNLYCTRDKKAWFGDPFLKASDELAKRDFIIAGRTDNSPIKLYKEDMSLYRVATFDNISGEVTPSLELILKAEDIE